MQLEEKVVSLELAQKIEKLGIKQKSLFYWNSYGVHGNTGSPLFVLEKSNKKNPTFSYSAFTAEELGEIIITERDDQTIKIQTTKDGTLTSIHSPQGFTMKLSKEDGCIIKPISKSKKYAKRTKTNKNHT